MKFKFFKKNSLGILISLAIVSINIEATTYLYVLDDKNASYSFIVTENNGSNIPNTGEPIEGAGEETPAPEAGEFDYEFLVAGNFASFLRSPNQTIHFGGGEIFTSDGSSIVFSGSLSASSENNNLYMDSVSLKSVYNPSTFNLTVSNLDSLSTSLTLPAQKNGTTLDAKVFEGITIEYDSSASTINFNNNVAYGNKAFSLPQQLYINYAGDSNTGNFTFSSPTSLVKGNHNTIHYTNDEFRVDFTGGEYLSFKDSQGFNVSGTSISSNNNYGYITTSNLKEGFYQFDPEASSIIWTAPLIFGAGSFHATLSGTTPVAYLKDGSDYVIINYSFGSLNVNHPTNDSFDCIGTTSCTSGSYNISYDSVSDVFQITNGI
jgi:hypothetical protein